MAGALEQMDGVPKPGEEVAGKYRVQHLVASGGMGVVMAAWHDALRRQVAIKFLRPHAMDQTGVARFLREARMVAMLRSEHVTRIYDVGTTDQGAPFIVMELLEGMDLTQLLRTTGPPPLVEAVDYILQACAGLAEAHRDGIVHRDIKPRNLFLTTQSDGSQLVKILDFGICKPLAFSETDQQSLTTTEGFLGTPAYMSPEHLRDSSKVDHRTDIWSLGVVLQQLISGRRPFEGETASAVIAKIVADEPLPITAYCADAPAGLVAVLRRCLQKDRQLRYRDVAELAADLQPLAGERCVASAGRVARVLSVARRPAAKSNTPDARPRVAERSAPPVPSPSSSAGQPSATTPLEGASAIPADWATQRTASSAAIGDATTQAQAPPSRTGETTTWPAGVPTNTGDGPAPSSAAPGSWRSDEQSPGTMGSPRRIWALALAALLLGGAVALVTLGPFARWRSGADRGDPAWRGSAATARIPDPSATADETDVVAIALQLEPADATVTVDGVETAENPIVLKRSDRAHELVVSAPGYTSVTRSVTAKRSHELLIALERATIVPGGRVPVSGTSTAVRTSRPGSKDGEAPWIGPVDKTW